MKQEANHISIEKRKDFCDFNFHTVDILRSFTVIRTYANKSLFVEKHTKGTFSKCFLLG